MRRLDNCNEVWKFRFVLFFYYFYFIFFVVKDRAICPYESVNERIPLAFVFLTIRFEKLQITITFSNGFKCRKVEVTLVASSKLTLTRRTFITFFLIRAQRDQNLQMFSKFISVLPWQPHYDRQVVSVTVVCLTSLELRPTTQWMLIMYLFWSIFRPLVLYVYKLISL